MALVALFSAREESRRDLTLAIEELGHRVISAANVKDALELIANVFPDADPDICEGDVVLLAEYKGQAVGFCHAVEEKGRIVLQGLGVEESARGHGIGTALLDRLFQVFSRSDKPMVLTTTMSNPALELYHHYGFRVKKFEVTKG